METLDRKAVVHMIQSIKVIGKKELEITFTYQDEYQKAIQLIQLAAVSYTHLNPAGAVLQRRIVL